MPSTITTHYMINLCLCLCGEGSLSTHTHSPPYAWAEGLNWVPTTFMLWISDTLNLGMWFLMEIGPIAGTLSLKDEVTLEQMGHTQSSWQEGKCHVNRKAEMGVIYWQAKELQNKASKPPGAGRGEQTNSQTWKEVIVPHLDLRLLSFAHQKWEPSHFYGLSCPVCGLFVTAALANPYTQFPAVLWWHLTESYVLWKLPGVKKNASSESLEY